MNDDIKIGDCVKVHDLDNPRNEFVEGIGLDMGENTVYLLSDGTWCRGHNISRYKVQGSERKALIDKLNEID